MSEQPPGHVQARADPGVLRYSHAAESSTRPYLRTKRQGQTSSCWSVQERLAWGTNRRICTIDLSSSKLAQEFNRRPLHH